MVSLSLQLQFKMIFLLLSLTGMDSNGLPFWFLIFSFVNSTNPLPSTFLSRMYLQDSDC